MRPSFSLFCAAERPKRVRSHFAAAKRSGCRHSPPAKSGIGEPKARAIPFFRREAKRVRARLACQVMDRSAQSGCDPILPPRSEEGAGIARPRSQGSERLKRVRSHFSAAKRRGCRHSPPAKSGIGEPKARAIPFQPPRSEEGAGTARPPARLLALQGGKGRGIIH